MVVGLVVLALIAPLSILTAVGAHRRGAGLPLAIGAGIMFPVTWTAWYVRDEHPYRREQQRVV